VNYCDEDIYVVHLLGPQGYFPPPHNKTVCSACSCSPTHDPCPTTNCSNAPCCDGSTPPICKNCSEGIELFDQGGFKLNATNGKKTYSNIGPWWEGAMWGRTGCTPINASDPHSPLNCTGAPTKDTISGYDSVSPGGRGGKPPASKFEWTFDGGLVNPKAMDVYDLSLVDGFNAPVMLYLVNGSFDPKNPWTDKNLSPYYANASGSAVDLNDKFKHGAGKLSRMKIPIMKNGTIYALHSACTYYQKLCDSGSPDCNRTLQDMACCNPPYGSDKSAPVHCDWDKYLPDDVNTKDFFKKYYPGVYSYAYDDGESTYQVRGLATRNTEYVCQFCRNDSQFFHSVSRPYGEVSSVWSSQTTPGGCFWQHPLGGFELDYGESIEPTSDGGYIIAGYTYSADGDVQDKIAGMDQSDFWVVKLASDGSIEWKKCLGGSDEDEAFDIIQTSDGGYLVVGYTASDDIPGSGKKGGSDNSDFFAVKLTADGSISWNKCYGGTDSEIARHVLQTSDGGYIIAGYTYSNDGDVTGKIAGSMNADYWILKIDGSGSLTWAKCYGGSNDDYGEAVSLLSDGYLVTGNSMSTDGQAIGNHGLNDFLVMKIDASGNVVWSTCYGGSFDDAGYDIISLPDGGGIAFGLTGSSDGQVTGNHGEDDFWAVRFDYGGSILWSKCYGGSDSDQGFEIVQSPITGRFLMVGTSQSSDGDLSGNYGLIDIWVIETDMNGNLIWQKNIGGSRNDYGNSLRLSSFGNVTVAGYTDSSDHDVIGQHGLYDMWAVQFSSAVPPHVDTISPESGQAGAEVQYTLIGGNFASGAIVNLTHPGQNNLTSIGTLSGNDITGNLKLPFSAAIGPWNVTVNQGGLFSNNDKQFTITAAPVQKPIIHNLNPGGVLYQSQSTPFPVTITGTGFDTVDPMNGVTLDGSSIQNILLSSTRIDAQFPETVDEVLGNHQVIVTGETGSSDPYNFVVSAGGFTITTISDGIGWINPSGPIYNVPAGSSKTFTFKPTAGAMIKNVTVNGNEVPLTSDKTYTIGNVDKNYVVRLNCEPLPGVIIPAFTATSLDGYNVRFTDASLGSPTTWKWDFGDKEHGEGNPVDHVYKTPGAYTVTLHVRNEFSQSQVVMGNIEVPMSNTQGSVNIY